MSKSLDPAAIASLLKKEQEEENTKRSQRIKRKTFKFEPRTYDTWFDLPTRFAECTNANCVDPRDNKLGKTMVAEVNSGEICRYCFLAGANKVTA